MILLTIIPASTWPRRAKPVPKVSLNIFFMGFYDIFPKNLKFPALCFANTHLAISPYAYAS